MGSPEYVTTIADRTPQYELAFRMVLSEPGLGSPETQAWFRNKYGATDIVIPGRMTSPAAMLAYAVLGELHNNNQDQVEKLMAELLPQTKKPLFERPLVEQWAHFAKQMPGDIGGPSKGKIRQLVTKRSSGKVLEAMCGFNTYIGNSKRIGEVVALDFCREMLERYARPERTRILYDLELVVRGEHMDFFADSTFNTIGCWGSNYLTDAQPVIDEFSRILAPKGKLLLLESTSEGYPDLVQRYFDPKEAASWMQQAGLKPKIEHLPLRTQWEIGEYYLVTGTKQ